ncbi:MAG TPA: DUF1517 domain-containing protein [Oscillatoriaceae cyanobacterium M33_DOE_052]|uniref:DUF1517 domain-containing protein n=1 Tax=Planktothricoides sp. SpSt-374 TaxID=2282167 RepID=A0A7C3ZJA6_9CYAN|nr:DUF1517 domain-containing protein [Oscillatoriaceae cyanobacterium M33_DOE_052]
MSSIGDRFNKMIGRTRFVVCRLFVHLGGAEVAPLLGVLNRAAINAIEADGDLKVLGESLVEICENLLRSDSYWRSAANEGDVFWEEELAGNYWNELFTDSSQRYLSEPNLSDNAPTDAPFSLPVTTHLVVMIAIAFEGEVPSLETDLANMEALRAGLKSLINLHYQKNLRAISVHFSPAQLGDQLTEDQLYEHFPELIPL